MQSKIAQPLTVKIAEIQYRKKISRQHSNNTIYFPNELSASAMLEELKRRAEIARDDFADLKEKAVGFSPYLEIGAEYCIRAAVLEKYFITKGFACDISLDALVTAEKILKKLGFSKIPERICCDVENLPIASNSLSFIFCYQTLHHFPKPEKVTKEVSRVLSDNGTFYFSEEPVEQRLNLNLWRRPTVLRPWERFLKYILILPFITRIGKTEVEHGIIEESFPLTIWEKSLSVFDKAHVNLKVVPFGPKDKLEKNRKSGWLKPNLITQICLWFFGGGIKGFATSYKKQQSKKITTLYDLLICPDCQITGLEVGLKKHGSNLLCPRCGRVFKKHMGVLLLLPKNLARKLYATA